MQLELHTAREGHWLSAVAADRLVPPLPAQTVGRAQVHEGEHRGNVGIVPTVDGQFFAVVSTSNHLLHLGDDRGGDGRAGHSRQFLRVEQHEHVVLDVSHLPQISLRELRRHRSPQVEVADHHVVQLHHARYVAQCGRQSE